VEVVISPEPSDEERAAILAALAEEAAEAGPPSRWPEPLLPEPED